jgi:hypothetical protein
MRLTAVVACLLTAGCAGAHVEPVTSYPISGEARQLASCAFRELRALEPTQPIRLTQLDDINGAEIVASVQACGLLGCHETAIYILTFQPNGPARTTLGVQTLLNSSVRWRRTVEPVVQRCSSRLAEQAR